MAERDDFNFWGEYEHGVDDKGRIVMPAEIRSELAGDFVLTRGPDRAILVIPVPVWREVERSLREAVLNTNAGLLQRMLGGRVTTRLDPQARLAIPKHLREWARITPDHTAVIVGQGRKCEIWSKSTWEQYQEHLTYANVYEAAVAAGLEDLLRV